MGIKAINPESTLPYLGQELPALLLGRRCAGRGGLVGPGILRAAFGQGHLPAMDTVGTQTRPLSFGSRSPSQAHLQWDGVGELTPQGHSHQNMAQSRCRDVWGGREEKVLHPEVAGHWDRHHREVVTATSLT